VQDKEANMERVIVTVKRKDEARVRDLEVPADVEASRLADLITQALHWESDAAGQPVEYEIVAEPPGRVLAPHESLAEVDAWDGSWLVFRRVGDTTSVDMSHISAPLPLPTFSDGPVSGWRSLGIDLPAASSQQPTPVEEKRPSGFVWKQVD
jgi:hypothetical protein